MKLKSDFITQEIDGTQFLVPVGGSSINGLARSNKSAAFIVDLLKEETTLDAIVDAMSSKYDADRDTITADVRTILDKLRLLGALEE
ncbi:MAG: PqqD family protein [Lachnospiraceae bacterium]|nr:PqqD family protein [Lachnospiraceae bacterium]